MKITRVCCQGCGADLEVDEDVRFATCNYCHARLEIVHDASVTHTRLMEKLERTTDRMAGNLRVIELQNDLERLDREWDRAREGFMVRGEHGHVRLPSAARSVFGGLVGAFMGIMLLILFSRHGLGLIGIVGLVIIVAAAAGAFVGLSKVEAYRSAEAAYQGKRIRMLRQMEEERRS